MTFEQQRAADLLAFAFDDPLRPITTDDATAFEQAIVALLRAMTPPHDRAALVEPLAVVLWRRT